MLQALKEGKEVDLYSLSGAQKYILGRNAATADIVLDHPSLSRQHCQLDLENGQWFLSDLKSSHGTFLNGQKLPAFERVAVKFEVDCFKVGGSTREYRLLPPASSAGDRDRSEEGKAPAAAVGAFASHAGQMLEPAYSAPPAAGGSRGRQEEDEEGDSDYAGFLGKAAAGSSKATGMPPPPPRLGGPKGIAVGALPAVGKDSHTDAPVQRADGAAALSSAAVKSREQKAAEISAIMEAMKQPVRYSGPPAEEQHSSGSSSKGAADGEIEEEEDEQDALAAAAMAAGIPLSFGKQAAAGGAGRAAAAAAAAAAGAGRPHAAANGGSDSDSSDSSSSSSDSESEGEGKEEEGQGGSSAAMRRLRLPLSHEAALGGHSKTVCAIAFEPSGARLATGSVDGTLCMFDFGSMDSSHRPFKQLTPMEGCAVTGLVYSAAGDKLLVTTGSSKAKVYDRAGNHLATCYKGDPYISDIVNTKGHTTTVTGGVWHPMDGDIFLTGSLDGSIRLWHLTSGKRLYDELTCSEVIKTKTVRGQKAGVQAVCWTPDGRSMLVGCEDGSLQCFRVKPPGHKYVRPDACVREAHSPSPAVLIGGGPGAGGAAAAAAAAAASTGTGGIGALCLSSSGKYVASRGLGDGTVKVWDTGRLSDSSKPLLIIEDVHCLHEGANAAWSPDETLLAVGTEVRRGTEGVGQVRVFNVQAALQRREREGGAAAGGAGAGGAAAASTSGYKPPPPPARLSSSDAVYSISVCKGYSAVHLLWQGRINQLAAGCGDGHTRILYSPDYSSKGALLSTAKVSKRRTLDDTAVTVGADGLPIVGEIIAPNALSAFRDKKHDKLVGVKRRHGDVERERAERDMATKKPALPNPASEPDFLFKGVKTFTEQWVATHPLGTNLREQDPAEVLRSYAAKAAAMSAAAGGAGGGGFSAGAVGVINSAYARTQPVRVLAEKTMEQEEEEKQLEKERLLMRNVAGK